VSSIINILLLPAFEKPKNLDKMIEYAEKLSKNFEFVRMDFYIDKNDDIYYIIS